MEEPFSSRKRQRLNEEDAFHQVAQPSAYEDAPSSSTQPKSPYDVFINHRGPDAKDTLAQDIHDNLSQIGLKVFLDKEAPTPVDSIPMEIQEAMDDACLHVAIFSERYAESPWCLAELSHMLKTGRTIVPVFYHVKPSDLRWADVSFAQLESTGRYEAENLREWKEALETVSYIDGYEVKYKKDWKPLFEGLRKSAVKAMNEAQRDWKPLFEGLRKSAVKAMNEAQVAGHTNARGLDQVAQQSAYDYAPSSSTQPKSPYDVFINHRGLDTKHTLAQAIHDNLSQIGVKVFLDKESLYRGDSIPMKIQEAMDDACLHVAIFSERYAESPWCLAELSHMLKTGRTIVPVFYHVKPSDPRWADVSFPAGRYEEEKLRKWKDALQTVSYRSGHEVKNKKDWTPLFKDLRKSAVRALREARIGRTIARPIVLPPSQGEYPHAVGLDNARDYVIGLLDLQDQSTRKIVVVYGVGGIGKTTLATAVFYTLDLTGYKHCRVVMKQDCLESDIKSLQEQILRDLFNKNVAFLRSCEEGQEQLSKSFREESTRPFFMFIDNALRGSDLAMLLPKDLSCLPLQSRMLITTRRLDETNILLNRGPIQRCTYPVEPLPRLEAKKLLCKSVDANFATDKDIDDLVECCGCIPLALEIVGSNLLSDGSKVSDWVNFLKRTRQQVEEELSEPVVDCVYNSFHVSYKEAFLDVASFFLDKERDYVAKIVGEKQMKRLEDAALVKTSDGRVTMHDIVRARGKWLSQSNRITDIQSLEYVFKDPQKLQQLKGIKIVQRIFESKVIKIQAEDLDLTSQTLRILNGVEVKGRCK